MTWAPAAGSVDDGAYRWTLEATDGWGNGPLQAHGDVDVDTHAPDVSVARRRVGDPDVHAQRRRLARQRRVHRRRERAGLDRRDGPRRGRGHGRFVLGRASAARTRPWRWDGKVGSGYVADGRYEIAFAARDRAGNTGDAVTRTVDAYGALGFVATSKTHLLPAGRRRERPRGHALVPARRPRDRLVDDRRRGRRRRAHAQDRRGARRGLVQPVVGRPRRRRPHRAARHLPLGRPRLGRRPRRDPVRVGARRRVPGVGERRDPRPQAAGSP